MCAYISKYKKSLLKKPSDPSILGKMFSAHSYVCWLKSLVQTKQGEYTAEVSALVRCMQTLAGTWGVLQPYYNVKAGRGEGSREGIC